MALFQDMQIDVAAQRAAIGLTKHVPKISVFAKNFAPIGDFYGNGVAVPVLGNTQGVSTQAPGTLTADVWCSNLEQATGERIALNQNPVKSYAVTDYEAGVTEQNDLYLADMGYAIGDYIGQEVAKYVFQTALGQSEILSAAGVTNLSAISKSLPALTATPQTAKRAYTNLAAEASLSCNPYDSVLVLAPAYFYQLVDALEYQVYGSQDAVRYGVVPGFAGFKDVVLAPELTGTIKGLIIPWNTFGVVARWNRPAGGGMGVVESWAEVDEKTGFPFGFRAFYHNCKGALIFGGDVLFGAKIVQKGIIPLVAES